MLDKKCCENNDIYLFLAHESDKILVQIYFM